jgi:predicted DNA-binding protein (MmcQ/YjbR family)
MFAMYAASGNHHGDGRSSVWCKATPTNQQLMIATDPDRYFKPPYVGPSGWIGVYLDNRPDWEEVRGVLEDGYRLAAPKRLIAQLDGA